MANNRMWLVNRRTGTRIYLAKYYPSTGWYLTTTEDVVNAGFDAADFGHLSPAARAMKSTAVAMGPPFSGGGMYGDEWVLEVEVVSSAEPVSLPNPTQERT